MVRANAGRADGSIYYVASKNLWRGAITLPATPSNPYPRKVVSVSANGKTEKQAIAAVEAKLNAIRRKRDRGETITSDRLTLGKWMEYWFEHFAQVNARPKTVASYKSVMRLHIIPTIGHVRLDALTPEHVRMLSAAIKAKGLTDTALKAHRVLAGALKYAEREGKIQKNVTTLTDPPRKTPKNLAVLTPADGIKVLQAAAGWPPPLQVDPLGSRWWAALLTGARQGELLGLELDRVGDDLDLSWQLQRLSWEHGCRGKCGRKRGNECPDRKLTAPNDWEHRHLKGGLWLSRPKSDAGWRIIPLVPPLRAVIEARVEVARTARNPHGLLWFNPDGSPLDPARDNKAWHRLLALAGVKDARLHDARHTTASLLLEANVPEPIIERILGHSSYAVSKKYMTVDRRQLVSALESSSALMSPQ